MIKAVIFAVGIAIAATAHAADFNYDAPPGALGNYGDWRDDPVTGYRNMDSYQQQNQRALEWGRSFDREMDEQDEDQKAFDRSIRRDECNGRTGHKISQILLPHVIHGAARNNLAPAMPLQPPGVSANGIRV